MEGIGDFEALGELLEQVGLKADDKATATIHVGAQSEDWRKVSATS